MLNIKKIRRYNVWIISLFIMMIVASGCSTDALLDYKKARNETEQIEKGIFQLTVQASMDFMEEGLTEEEKLSLSYFDHLDFEVQCKHEEEQSITKVYMNLGGMGLDTTVYTDQDNSYMEMPIIDGYLSLNDFYKEQKNINYEEIDHDFQFIANQWNAILNQEDVVKGSKIFILTEEGQLKTTKYTIQVEEKQLKVFYQEILQTVKEEGILEQFLITNDQLSEEQVHKIIVQMEDYLERIEMDAFHSEAYVDFDGRLVKENFFIEAHVNEPKKGELKRLQLSVEMNYLNLGQEQNLKFPIIQEEDWIQIEDGRTIESIIPEQLF